MSLSEERKKNKEESLNVWNGLADAYQEKFQPIRIYDESYRELIKMIPPSSHVLELGAGPGMISSFVHAFRTDLRFTITDAVPSMVELAARNLPTAKVFQLDTDQISTLTENYDAVIMGFLIPYLSMTELDDLFCDLKMKTNTNFVIYVSWVEGNEEASGWKINSRGERVYFYYHQGEKVLQSLLRYFNLTESKLLQVEYPVENGQEIHSIAILKLRRKINA